MTFAIRKMAVTGTSLLLIAGCANRQADDPFWTDIPAPTPGPVTVSAPTPAGDDDAPLPRDAIETGEMMVEDVEVRIFSAAPSNVEVVVRGALADACTSFRAVEQAREGDTVVLTLTTERPADLLCTQELRPYERTVALDGTFDVGSYRVIANGYERTFEVPASGGGDWVTGLAFIDTVEVLLLESFPVQVTLVVSGWLPDGCTELDEVRQARTGNTIEVTMTTRRPADAFCTQALVEFTERVRLDGGFVGGDYVVRVNEVEQAFHVD